MIVISRAFGIVEPPDYDINENSPLVGWRNFVTADMVSADSSDPSFPPLNVANPTTYLKWLSTSTADQYLTIATGGPPQDVDYVAIARHNLGTAQITVSIEGYIAGVWTEIVEETLLSNDEVTIFRFTQMSLTSLRIRMQSGDDPPSIAVVYAGLILQLQRRIYVGHTPFPYGRVTNVVNNKSENGNFLGRIIISQTNATSFTMSNIDRDWYRTYMDPFIDAAQDTPFFFSWRPGTFPRESGYAWMSGNPVPVNQSSNGMMKITLQMGGIVR